MILRSALLFLICTTISAQGDEAIIDHDDNDRRHLQQPAQEGEVVFDILTGEQITPSATSNESPVPAPTPAFLEDGIISGTVYNDVNGNGQRDQASSSSQEESPVSGVIVDLFNCDTGAQEGYTTTNSNGYYALSISEKYLPEDTTSKNCYYIQYTVLDDTDNDDSDTTVFTTPPNGETSDIYLGRGETIPNVDAGIMQELLGGSNGVFTEWTSYFPTFAPSVSMGTEDEADGASFESTVTPTLSPTLEQMTTTSPEVEETEAAIDEQDNESIVNLRSSVRLQLSNIDTRMKRDTLSLFESVCADFLNSQIKNDSTAVPPLNDLNCNVLRQDIVEQERARVRRQRRLRSLRLGRFLDESTEPVNDGSTSTTTATTTSSSISSSSSLIVRVRVMGHTNKTSSVQEAADVKFRDVLVKTFNDQGTQFTKALKEESASSMESSSETAEYFNDVGTITSVVSSEVIGGASGAQKSSEGNKEGGGNKGVVAAIVVCIVIGSVFVIGLITLRKRRRRRKQSNQSTETNADTAGGMSDVGGNSGGSGSSSSDSMAISKAFLRSAVPRFNTDSPPCTPPSNITAASSFSPNSMCSYVGSDGEVEILQDGLDAHPNALIRRDVMAPPGQLGLLVKGNANTIGYGPAVHVIKPGSPMEGLLHVEDRIVAINDVDTREFSAEDIIQVMTDTNGSERKITVLSDQP